MAVCIPYGIRAKPNGARIVAGIPCVIQKHVIRATFLCAKPNKIPFLYRPEQQKLVGNFVLKA